MKIIHVAAILFITGLLIYSRFVNIGWGLPYPLHPDERNMTIALQQLSCKEFSFFNFQSSIKECLNPHFFAYGQFPLYLAYFGIFLFHFIAGINSPITFSEATIALRMISAIASIINVWVVIKIIDMIQTDIRSKIKGQRAKFQVKDQKFLSFDFLPLSLTFTLCLLTFSPYFIQFSHFGTTESLLMLFYSLIILFSLKIISSNKPTTNNQQLIYLSIVSGLAIATKISSVVFLSIPIISIITSGFWENRFFFRLGKPERRGTHWRKKSMRTIIVLFLYLLITILVSLIFSPHNFISFNDFYLSIKYESFVALGNYIAFYTRQFVNTIPVWFQIKNIFPFVMGWPQFILFILGFLFLPRKNARLNLLRFAFLVYFIPNAFVFTKWTRFMAPIFPIMSVFAILFLLHIVEKLKIKSQRSKVQVAGQKLFTLNFLILFLTFAFCLLTCLPGIAFLSIYTSPDVRFTASDWIYKNIPNNSKILSETANVIDIPIPTTNNQYPISNYQYISFNFYDLDQNISLQNNLSYHSQQADYIFIPSRRIILNHPKKQYPLLHSYYQDLLSGKSGFKLVKTFSSYPRISLFGKTIVEFPDEQAEESWSVFDHPVIRIYKRIQNSESRIQNSTNKSDFSDYQTTTYILTTKDQQPTTLRLLVADTPEKWEKGLMFVKSKKDINGLDGMIFQFPTSEIRTFWNKNTVSDLTLYWLNKEKVIGTSHLPSIEDSKNIVSVLSPGEIDSVIEIIN